MAHSRGWWRYISHDPSQGTPRVNRRLFGRVIRYARPYWRSVLIVLATIVAISLLNLVPPLLYRELIDEVLPNQNVSRLNLLALIMVGIPVASGLISVVQRYFNAKVGEGIIYDLRQQLFAHLQHMPLRFFTHTKSGEIISRLNNDVVGAQNAVTGTIPNIATNTFTLVSTLAVMLTIEWRLTLLSMSVLPLFLLPVRRVGRILRDIRRRALEYNADMSSRISETLNVNGALLVKTFGRRDYEIEEYRKVNASVRDVGIRRATVGRWFFMGLSVAGALGTALTYWIGGHFVLQDAISIGTIVMFVAYLERLYGPISALSNVQVEFAQAMVSFERVFEYLDMPLEIEDKPDAAVLKRVDGAIDFENVSFSYLEDPLAEEAQAGGIYPHTQQTGNRQNGSNSVRSRQSEDASSAGGEGPTGPNGQEQDTDTQIVSTRLWALKDVSFHVEPGQLVALVGPSGAGKTTITYLLPRLYDPIAGSIRLDGHNLRDVTLDSLAAQIGIVTQETYLLHDTIAANLRYASPDATRAEMENACRAANIHEFIVTLPDGYETKVGERGYRLSGGEKQRLAIARVILMDPRILILDEATAHLDSQSEALIQAALEPLFQDRTSIVIAHRLSTILAADKILVLDKGRLVEEGTHEFLLKQNGLYADLYRTQFDADRDREGSAAKRMS